MELAETEVGQNGKVQLHTGDCLEVLAEIASDSLDALLSDPPAGVSFMSQDWDCFRRTHNPADVGRESVMGRMSAHAPASGAEGERDAFIAFMTPRLEQCLRVLKPGAFGLVWALPRTAHWTGWALESAGFEVRDQIHHVFSTGFPKSLNVSKQIDKLNGAERAVIGESRSCGIRPGDHHFVGDSYRPDPRPITAAASEEAQRWEGFGTALKPAHEVWWLVRKPLSEKNVALNLRRWGTGALNLGACEVPRAAGDVPGWHQSGASGSAGYLGTDTFQIHDMTPEEIQARRGDKGRWPPNLVFSHASDCDTDTCAADCPVAELDRQSGTSKSGSGKSRVFKQKQRKGGLLNVVGEREAEGVNYADQGGASRYFPCFRYQPKPSRSEKEAGLDDMAAGTLHRINPGGIENDPRWAPVARKNTHPTVKSIQLMRWLARLVAPPGGTLLDPFLGSGSSGCAARAEGFSFLGIDLDPHYVEIARRRIAHWERQG